MLASSSQQMRSSLHRRFLLPVSSQYLVSSFTPLFVHSRAYSSAIHRAACTSSTSSIAAISSSAQSSSPITSSCSLHRRYAHSQTASRSKSNTSSAFSKYMDPPPKQTSDSTSSAAPSVSSAPSASLCWRCGAATASSDSTSTLSTTAASSISSSSSSTPLFCPSCHILQPDPQLHHSETKSSGGGRTKNRSYFDLFQIPDSYDISLPQLESMYKSLQKSLHPDRYDNSAATRSTNKSKVDQVGSNIPASQTSQHAIASQLAAQVNAAYAILKDPYDRALYMLSMHGQALEEETDSVTDPELLMEIMEIREELESTSSLTDLTRLNSSNRRSLESLYSSMTRAYSAGDITEMRHLTIKLSYLQNIEAEIHKKMPVQ